MFPEKRIFACSELKEQTPIHQQDKTIQNPKVIIKKSISPAQNKFKNINPTMIKEKEIINYRV